MIGYVTVGTNDMAKAAAFYDELLGELGAKRLMDFESFIVWGENMQVTSFSIINPFDGGPATVGNGVMVALTVSKPEQVQSMHAKALALGGKDEGAPGPRSDNFYAAYFRDLDGNKLNVFCMT